MINGLFTVIALIALVCCIVLIPELRVYNNLLWLGAFKLVFNFLLLDWLYRGLEEFKYITSRSIIVRSIYVISVFLLVREETDYVMYYFLSIAMIVVNAIINCSFARYYVSFCVKGISYLTLKKQLKSFLILGFYTILTSMYTTFNVVYLGFVAGDTQVGYYTTATKLYSIILSLFTAFTTVMLPRISSLLSEGDIQHFKALIGKSLSILITFSIPAIIFTVIFANQIILLISGDGYGGAVVPMRIVMPLILVIGLEQILVIQILMPMKKDKIIFINSIVGAILGVLLNIFFVRQFQSIGSSAVWLTCEIVILTLSFIGVKRALEFKFPFGELIKNILFYAPLILILCAAEHYLILPVLPLLMIGFGFTSIYVLFCQIVLFKGSATQILILNMSNKFIHRH